MSWVNSLLELYQNAKISNEVLPTLLLDKDSKPRTNAPVAETLMRFIKDHGHKNFLDVGGGILCSAAFLVDNGAENVVFVDILSEKIAVTNITAIQKRHEGKKFPGIYASGDSRKVLPRLLTTDKLPYKQFDAAYIDGAEDFATKRLDVENALRLLKEGGHILVRAVTPSLLRQIAWLNSEGICEVEGGTFNDIDGVSCIVVRRTAGAIDWAPLIAMTPF